MCQLIIASMICSIGFVTDSETVVIGSMLISPIGGAIYDTLARGRYGPVKILTSMVVCITAGFIAAQIHPAGDTAVKGRGQAIAKNPWLLLAGSLVAMAGGTVFVSSSIPTNIGLGIATALLPPLVAVGYYMGRMVAQKKDDAHHYEWKDVGFGFSNFACNVAGVLLSALAVQAIGKRTNMCGFREAFSRTTVVPVGK